MADFRGDVLLFTDDDMWLAPNWLAAYSDAISKFPEADYFGGRILPHWVEMKPRWIRDEPLPLIDGVLGWFDLGVQTRPYRSADQGPVGGVSALGGDCLRNWEGFDVIWAVSGGEDWGEGKRRNS